MTDNRTPIERFIDGDELPLDDYTGRAFRAPVEHDNLAERGHLPPADQPIDVEFFPCAGGMGKGFADAGVNFHLAIELEKNHCDSYQANLGHRPVCMDARDFLRILELGFTRKVRLAVFDPPCTPWSRSGKREGCDDPRDMLQQTCEIIRVLRPECYLIGNVPGLDDGPNLHIVQRLIGGLSKYGYCTADFTRLDAANYGVPQHRIRPFWFGHLKGPCMVWPEPTHADPAELKDQLTLPHVRPLKPWVTCGQALGHLPPDELGRRVKVRNRGESKREEGDFTIQERRGGKNGLNTPDAPSHAILRNTHGNGTILVNDKHRPPTMDEPSNTVRGGGDGHSAPPHVLEWPWDRPATTVQCKDTLAPPGHHDESYAIMSLPNAVVLSEKAATILQGFPESWSFAGDTKKVRYGQLGQAMPPPLAFAVATSVVRQMELAGNRLPGGAVPVVPIPYDPPKKKRAKRVARVVKKGRTK